MPSQIIGLLLLLPLAASFAWAQTQGQITGVVSDASGAVVAGATITVTNPQTNFTRRAQTNSAGNYVFPTLLPGVYRVRVEMQGFQSEVRNQIELQIDQVARIDFQLKVGAVTESVEVTEGAPLLNTEDVTIGTVIENRRIVELPLNGRNFLQLVALSPNVTSGFDSGGGARRDREATGRTSSSRYPAAEKSSLISHSTVWIIQTSTSTATFSCRPSMRCRSSRCRPGFIPRSSGARRRR